MTDTRNLADVGLLKTMLGYLLRKDDPTASDVHVDAPLGSYGAKPKKKKPPSEHAAKAEWSVCVQIEKSATVEDQRLVFGWANVVEKGGEAVVDTQGHVISEADLEAAFYDFARDARGSGEMHDGGGFGDMVECMVFTKAKQAALGIDLGQVGAWVGFRLPPEMFEKVKDGTYPAFSIQGFGELEPMED